LGITVLVILGIRDNYTWKFPPPPPPHPNHPIRLKTQTHITKTKKRYFGEKVFCIFREKRKTPPEV